MKKLSLLLLALVFAFGPLAAVPFAAMAAGPACPSGSDGECSGATPVCDTSVTPFVCVASDDAGNGSGNGVTGSVCKVDGDCGGNLACISGTCKIDPSLEDSGTAAPGGACGMNDSSGNPIECPGDQSCVSGICTGATGDTTSTNNNGSAAASGNCTSTNGDGFTSLSCIPGFAQAESSNGLIAFFNTIYQLCIGIAAVIAVIQITRAGILYMGSDSVGNKTYAKELIQMSLVGLALVLAPVLIFGIINKSILSLTLNGLDSLTVAPGANTGTGTGTNPSGTGSGSACTGTDGTRGTCPSDEICHVSSGQTQGTCSGTSVGNNTAGGTSIFDGQYMDLEKYPTSQAAQSGTCSATGQVKTVFNCTQQDASGACIEDYAACVTPSLNYTVLSVDPPGLFNATETPIPSDQTAYTAFKGECGRLESELDTIRSQRSSFANSALTSDSVNGATVTCPSGSGPTTYEPGTDISCTKGVLSCTLQ